MKRLKLGGLEVSEQGLGCMGMSEWRGTRNWDESVATIRRAIELGVTFLDTSDVYGSGHNEVLIGRAIEGLRDQVQVASKVGIDRSNGDLAWTVRGDRPYVKRACEASLSRLGIERLDMYYVHQMPKNVEIEEMIGTMAELVSEGKVATLGLSNVDAETVRRAHKVHPIAAVQSEYSLWTRDVEKVTPVMAELGIGLVPYGPLGRGFLTGELNVDSLEKGDLRKSNPRFQSDTIAANLAIVDAVRVIAIRHRARASQVALAWVYAQSQRLGVPIVPIPGTKRIRWLEENVKALDVQLPVEDIRELDALADRTIGASFEFEKTVAWAN